MILYHATTAEGAQQIDAHGFSDTAGYYRPEVDRAGVWVSDRPHAVEGASAPPVFVTVEAPEPSIAEYEWSQPNQSFREWLVPAKVLNAFPRRRAG